MDYPKSKATRKFGMSWPLALFVYYHMMLCILKMCQQESHPWMWLFDLGPEPLTNFPIFKKVFALIYLLTFINTGFQYNNCIHCRDSAL